MISLSTIIFLSKQEIMSPDRQVQRDKACCIVCDWTVKELGMSGADMGHLLKIGQPTLSRAVGRDKRLVDSMKLKLIR